MKQKYVITFYDMASVYSLLTSYYYYNWLYILPNSRVTPNFLIKNSIVIEDKNSKHFGLSEEENSIIFHIVYIYCAWRWI